MSTKGLTQQFGKLKRAMVALATAKFAKDLISGADSVGKLSTRLGESVEFLSAMQFVARRSGVQVNNFNMAVQRANRRIGEFASMGSGEAAPAIKKLGLRVKDSEGNILSFEELLPQLADRFSEVKSSSEKLRLAFKLFDSEGVSMLQILSKQRSGIKELIDDSKRYGAVITSDMADKSEKAVDALGNLIDQFKGLGRETLVPLMPILQGTAKFIGKITDGIRSFGETSFGQMLSRQLRAEFHVLTEADKAGKSIKDTAEKTMPKINKAVQDLGKNLETPTKAYRGMEQAAIRMAADGIGMREAFVDTRTDLERMLDHAKFFERHLGASTEQAMRMAGIMKEVESSADMRVTIEDNIRATEQLGAALQSEVGRALNAIIFQLEDVGEIIKSVATTLLTLAINLAVKKFLPFADGGPVEALADGGKIKGYPTGGMITRGARGNFGRDNTLIAAQIGEGVVTRQAMRRFGEEFLNSINNGTAAVGGGVQITNVIKGGLVDGQFVRRRLSPMLERQVTRWQTSIPATRVQKQGSK
jgi:hypothetical protein